MKIILLVFLFAIVTGGCNTQKSNIKTSPKTDTIYQFRNGSADGIGKFYQGREIAHVMGAAGSEWLERDSRNLEENTTAAVQAIEIPVNGVIADIGAGTGYYSFRLAKKVPHGKVFAVDIQDEMLAQLQQRKKQLKDSVVEIVKGTEKSPNLPDNSVDIALMVDVYHELEHPHEMLQALAKALKPTGKILLIEYRGEDPTVPIKELHKMSVAQTVKELEANGFRLVSKGNFLPIQHFLLFGKTVQ